MLRNREMFGRDSESAGPSTGAAERTVVRRADAAGDGRRVARRATPSPRRNGTLAAMVVLAVAGLAACGADSAERARAGGDDASGSVGSMTPAARPESGRSGATVLASSERVVTEPETVPVDPAPPANVSYGDAESVFRSGEYEEAADLFDAYTVRRPENPWGHYMLGLSAWRSADHERAEAALRRTIEIDPNHVKGLLNLARVLLEERKASDALGYVERAVDLTPQSGEGWRVLGNARSELGRVDEAIEAYHEALGIDHGDAWTMNNLGLLMIHEGRYEEALPPLARATELRPDVAIFQNNLGIALERGGHGAEAAEAFRAALAADAGHEKARVSLERVEARAATDTAPLDLAGLADRFAGDIVRWKEARLGEGPGETEAVVDTERVVESRDPPSTRDTATTPDTAKTRDTVEVPGPVKIPDTVKAQDTVRTRGPVPPTTPRG